ncbi:MAG TPA: hypothetical protein DCY79_02460 [Planctomycetaceae bacterium]|nr:hypothetical protein [Blastopirellula sp.]HAY78652.1 hypothetical protein [Planctomycetaceae bacterium]
MPHWGARADGGDVAGRGRIPDVNSPLGNSSTRCRNYAAKRLVGKAARYALAWAVAARWSPGTRCNGGSYGNLGMTGRGAIVFSTVLTTISNELWAKEGSQRRTILNSCPAGAVNAIVDAC